MHLTARAALTLLITALITACGVDADLDLLEEAHYATTSTLVNGAPVSGLAAATGDETFFRMFVPHGAADLTFKIGGGTGDADLYVKYGGLPTTSSFDCRPNKPGNDELCQPGATPGYWYVMLRADKAYSGLTLTGSFSGPPVAAFSFSMTGLTVAYTDTSTDSDGAITRRSWNLGDGGASSAADPVHVYSAPGTYTVTLMVTDDQGLTDSAMQTIQVGAALTDSFSGSLSGTDDFDAQPNGTYYYSGSGTHTAQLIGPANADFDLYLYKWQSGWKKKASSLGATSIEQLVYNGTSGYYHWKVVSYSGGGDYTLYLGFPD